MLETSETVNAAPHNLIDGLIRKAHDHSLARAADDTINWNLSISPPSWLSEEQYIRMISNLIYGEKSTVEACKILQMRFENGVHHEFLKTQVTDELHHADLYQRYLELLEYDYKPSKGWCHIIEKCLREHSSTIELVLAFHILLEGEAIFLQKLIGEHMSCPLFADINNKIRTDEARHVAFGRILLPELAAELSSEEKVKLMNWAKELWFSSANTLVTEYLDPGAAHPDMIEQVLEARWQGQKEMLLKLGLS